MTETTGNTERERLEKQRERIEERLRVLQKREMLRHLLANEKWRNVQFTFKFPGQDYYSYSQEIPREANAAIAEALENWLDAEELDEFGE